MRPWTESFDPAKFATARQQRGWSQEEVSSKADQLLRQKGLNVRSGGVSVRTISKVENGDPTVTPEYLELCAEVLGEPLEFFQRGECPRPVVSELVRVCLVAVFAAYSAAWAAILRPWEIDLRPTSRGKIGAHDPTAPVDQSTSDVMQAVFQQFATTRAHPLSQGFLLVDEERPPRLLPDGASSWQYIAQLDSMDDSNAAGAGVGGSILVSIYKRGVGFIAAAACDLMKGIIYSRGINANTQAIRLASELLQNPVRSGDFQEPVGVPVTLTLSGRKDISNAVINLYLGHANRIGLTATQAPNLVKRNDVNVVSFGGSRGPLLVTEGVIDASVEFAKGFKLLDAAAGLFLARGAGAVVQNLDDNASFNLGPDEDLEAIFRLPETTWPKALDEHRVRFVVAATGDLATGIRALLPQQGSRVAPA